MKGKYDLELMATRKRDEDGNIVGFEAKDVTCEEQDHSSVGQALSESIKSDARQMLVESKFQEALAQFAKTGPTRPIIWRLGVLRTFRLGRVKRGPGKGRVRTMSRFLDYRNPLYQSSLEHLTKSQPGDYAMSKIQPAAITVMSDMHYSLPNVPAELLRGDTYFASEMVARHAAPRAILDGVNDESENL